MRGDGGAGWILLLDDGLAARGSGGLVSMALEHKRIKTGQDDPKK